MLKKIIPYILQSSIGLQRYDFVIFKGSDEPTSENAVNLLLN